MNMSRSGGEMRVFVTVTVRTKTKPGIGGVRVTNQFRVCFYIIGSGISVCQAPTGWILSHHCNLACRTPRVAAVKSSTVFSRQAVSVG